MTTQDPVARKLAAGAVGLPLVAIAFAGYALSMTFRHRDEVRALGDVLHHIGTRDVPMASPPAELDPDDR